MSTFNEEFRVARFRRLDNTKAGNPRWELISTRGRRRRTAPDSQSGIDVTAMVDSFGTAVDVQDGEIAPIWSKPLVLTLDEEDRLIHRVRLETGPYCDACGVAMEPNPEDEWITCPNDSSTCVDCCGECTDMGQRVKMIEGVVTLEDGTKSEFVIGADGGWQQWGARRERLGETVKVLEEISTALLQGELLVSEE